MKNHLFRLWILATMLCGLPISNVWGKAQDAVCQKTAEEAHVLRNDENCCTMAQSKEQAQTDAFLNTKRLQHIGSSRSIRLLPTNSGKPGRPSGRGNSKEPFHFSKFHALLLYCMAYEQRIWAASPRFYYVIRLRRILC